MNPSRWTIMAVASAPGASGRAIVRLSGLAVPILADRLISSSLPPRELCPTRFHLGDALCLPVLAVYFPSPSSFTAQHILEIQLPSNAALLERVMHRLIEVAQQLDADVRFAAPGEFTRQAFEAGRIDLARAEGIAATIGAVSDGQLQAAALLRRGALGRWAEQVVDELSRLLALVEAGIDFVDQEDVTAIGADDLQGGLNGLIDQIDRMAGSSRQWADDKALPWVVLVGEPNAGKSSLFNALLGHERAVISDAAGTTRDVLAEPMSLGDGEVMLVDIAGIEQACDGLGQAMQSTGAQAVDRADLLVQVCDRDLPDVPIRKGVGMLRLRSKADTALGELGQFDLVVSAHTGQGVTELKQAIAQKLADHLSPIGGQIMMLQPRHLDCLSRARAELVQAREHDQAELVAESMRTALDHLGEVGGQMSRDDVIGKVFATFCVGK